MIKYFMFVIYCVFSHGLTYAQCLEFQSPLKVGAIANEQLVETSGVAISHINKSVIWAHNDSGDLPRIFALDKSGDNLGEFELNGITNIDFEDIAVGVGPDPNLKYVYIGDIGDNNEIRPSIFVYRLVEPVVDFDNVPISQTINTFDTIELLYPDGSRDAESLFIDPQNADLYIITKREKAVRLYRAAAPLSTTTPATLEFKTEIPLTFVTAADISPDGSLVIVRNYIKAHLYTRSKGEELWKAFDQTGCPIPLAVEIQGESIGFDPSGCGYYTASEGLKPDIYYMARNADFNTDAQVDTLDLRQLIRNRNNECNEINNFCNKTDLDRSTKVDKTDFIIFTENFNCNH